MDAEKAEIDTRDLGKPEAGVTVYADGDVVSKEEEKRLVRKLDLIIMPLVSSVVMFQFIDKSSLNAAGNLLGLTQELMKQNEGANLFSWLGSAFFFGYLVGAVCHGIGFQYAPLAPYLSINCIVWGVVLACHAACSSFAQLCALRVLLGIFEACIHPGFILLMGRFYMEKEQATRISTWYSMNGWGTILSQAIAYGFVVHPPKVFAAWKEPFLVFGVITVFFGLLCLFLLPSSPEHTRFLTERQRAVAVHRVASNKTGLHDGKFRKHHLIEALLDIRLYFFFLAYFCANVSNGGILNFSSAIIKSFNFDTPKVALLGMAQGAAQIVLMNLGALLFKYSHNRTLVSVLGYLISVVGSIMIIAVPANRHSARMAGFCLALAYTSSGAMLYSWVGNSVSGHTKRIVFNSVVQLSYGAGNIVGPQTYQDKDAPGYLPAKITMLSMFAGALAFTLCISAIHLIWNRYRTAARGEEDANLSDLSDKQRPNFKYPY